MSLNLSEKPTDTQPNPFLPPQSTQLVATQTTPVSDTLITFNHITYALYVFSYFTAGLTWIVPIVMNYIKRDEARHTWLYSHFDWQIKTFWYSLFFGVIAGVLMMIGFGGALFGAALSSNSTFGGSVLIGLLGGLVMFVTVIWHLYRIVRGWIALNNRRAVP